jgi:hypothetical protein
MRSQKIVVGCAFAGMAEEGEKRAMRPGSCVIDRKTRPPNFARWIDAPAAA